MEAVYDRDSEMEDEWCRRMEDERCRRTEEKRARMRVPDIEEIQDAELSVRRIRERAGTVPESGRPEKTDWNELCRKILERAGMGGNAIGDRSEQIPV